MSEKISPRARRIVTPKQKEDNNDPRDIELGELHLKVQTLTDILTKAKMDRESLVSTISHLEEQLRIVDSNVLEMQQQRVTEIASFKRNLENMRVTMENRHIVLTNNAKKRDEVLSMWAEWATMCICENPTTKLKNILAKTCLVSTAAKETTSKTYKEVVGELQAILKDSSDTADVANQQTVINETIKSFEEIIAGKKSGSAAKIGKREGKSQNLEDSMGGTILSDTDALESSEDIEGLKILEAKPLKKKKKTMRKKTTITTPRPTELEKDGVPTEKKFRAKKLSKVVESSGDEAFHDTATDIGSDVENNTANGFWWSQLSTSDPEQISTAEPGKKPVFTDDDISRMLDSLGVMSNMNLEKTLQVDNKRGDT